MDNFFPQILLIYLNSFRQVFSKPNWIYFKSFVWALILVKGRKCVSAIAEVCFFLDKSISSFERFLSEYSWDLQGVISSLVKLLIRVLGEKLKVKGAFLMALDNLIIAKGGRKMIGVQKWKDVSSNPDRGEYRMGHQWVIGAFLNLLLDKWFCWPIICRLVSGKKKPSLFISTDRGLREATFFEIALALVLQVASLLGGLPLRVVADSFFAKAPFLNPLISSGIDVISRLRKDAVGWDDPPPYSGRGRPRIRGRRWKLSEILGAFPPQKIEVETYGKSSQVSCVTKDIWLRDLSQKVRVVIVEGNKEPILLVSTDRTLSARAIIEIYASRFSLEIAIRDLKEHLGFGDYQATTTLSIVRFVHLSCLSFCLWRLMLLPQNASSWLVEDSPKIVRESAFSFARARRGLRRFIIRRILFSKSASDAKFEKVEEEYEPLFRIAA